MKPCEIFVITGCTTGTGLVAAKTAAKKGAHVVMLNRRSHLALGVAVKALIINWLVHDVE